MKVLSAAAWMIAAAQITAVAATQLRFLADTSTRPTVPTILNTTFPDSQCPTWTALMWRTGTNPCHGSGLPLSIQEDRVSPDGNYASIISAGNNPSGGGKGVRCYRWNGMNNQTTGLRVTIPGGPRAEVWIRYVARFSLGFRWLNGQPHYSKELYFDLSSHGTVLDLVNNHLELIIQGTGQTHASANGTGWKAINGGALGDGRFHTYELHLKANTSGSNGVVQVWVDNVLRINVSHANFGSGARFEAFSLPNNQSQVVGTPPDHYTDYDDLAISVVGRIGPVA